MEEALETAEKNKTIGEQRVQADDLTGRHKRRRNKEERLESVLTGREVRTVDVCVILPTEMINKLLRVVADALMSYVMQPS